MVSDNMKKVILIILLMGIFLNSVSAVEYVPLQPPQQGTSQGTTGQSQTTQMEKLNTDLQLINGNIQTLNTKIENNATVDNLRETIQILKRQQDEALSFYLLIYAILDVLIIVGTFSFYLILKGKRRL